MADAFTHQKLLWLKQVARDAALTSVASRMAIILCCCFINRARREAWPAVATVAGDLGVSPTTPPAAHYYQPLINRAYQRTGGRWPY
jgi:hypothetical protein